MKRYLCEASVLLKDFGAYAIGLSNRIRAAAHAFAGRERRPVRYLHSTALSKEELARTLAERDQVHEGLIGLFDIVEPCLTSEFATDIMFKSPAAFASIYPQLVQHGIQHCGSAEVLRYQPSRERTLCEPLWR
jgi:hypothetical protein